LIIIALLAAPIAAAAGEVVQLNAAALSRAGVLTRPVLERSFGEQFRIVGEVVRSPGTTLTIKTPVQARVEQFLVSPGDAVHRSDPLLMLHSHEVHALEGDVLSLREQWRLAKSRLEAGEQLYELEGISRIELDQRAQNAMAAEIAYHRAEHELQDLGFDDADIERLFERNQTEGKLTIRAPSDGVVLEMSVQRHQWTEAFEPLIVLGNPRDLELEVKIQPSDAARVGTGDIIDFVPVGRTEEAGRARVLTPIPRVDLMTRTVTVRAAIMESATQLFPGVFVEGTLTHGDARRSLSVPESAVIRLGGGDYVFIATGESGGFEARSVELGRFNGTRYEILTGLSADEQVAVEGVFLLKSALLEQQGSEE
jgi:cobalt-zinc-cadmium efflux system membrane fusion protein